MERTLYTASVNIPGYLPMADEPAVFRTPEEAWSWLRGERERGEDDCTDDTWRKLDRLSEGGAVLDASRIVGRSDTDESTGTVYGDTPGYDGAHDQGLAYTVSIWEHSRYPHPEGYLSTCEVCLYTCHCDPDPDSGHAPCVHCRLAATGESSCYDDDCEALNHD